MMSFGGIEEKRSQMDFEEGNFNLLWVLSHHTLGAPTYNGNTGHTAQALTGFYYVEMFPCLPFQLYQSIMQEFSKELSFDGKPGFKGFTGASTSWCNSIVSSTGRQGSFVVILARLWAFPHQVLNNLYSTSFFRWFSSFSGSSSIDLGFPSPGP